MPEAFDAIVIGTGQAGPALAVRLAGAGRRVAIIERSRFGGTCVNNGCIPTKTLIASARAAHVARDAARFGVDLAGGVRVDMGQGQGAQGRDRRGIDAATSRRGCAARRTSPSSRAMRVSPGRIRWPWASARCRRR